VDWKEFTVEYRFRSSTYVIRVENPDGVQRGLTELAVDGHPVEKAIPLVDDGRTHNVTASMRRFFCFFFSSSFFGSEPTGESPTIAGPLTTLP